MTALAARMVEVDDLVSLKEIARRAGTSPGVVYHWRADDEGRYPDFPPPITQDGQWLVFLWSEVSTWIESRFGSSDRPYCLEDVAEV